MNLYKFVTTLLQFFTPKEYVIIDPIQNTITLSKKLLFTSQVHTKHRGEIFMYKDADKQFAFIVAPKDPQLKNTQMNYLHKKRGKAYFYAIQPTTGRIIYDYNLPTDKIIKLKVQTTTNKHGDKVCKLIPPYDTNHHLTT